MAVVRSWEQPSITHRKCGDGSCSTGGSIENRGLSHHEFCDAGITRHRAAVADANPEPVSSHRLPAVQRRLPLRIDDLDVSCAGLGSLRIGRFRRRSRQRRGDGIRERAGYAAVQPVDILWRPQAEFFERASVAELRPVEHWSSSEESFRVDCGNP